MADDVTRWKKNGLPREGWKLIDVIDYEEVCQQCDWCGTDLRYVHEIDEQWGKKIYPTFEAAMKNGWKYLITLQEEPRFESYIFEGE